MFYLHFWTKNGNLDRIPFESIEEAEQAFWNFERSERFRITGTRDFLYDGSFAGKNRDKMATIISNEQNEIQNVPFLGMGFIWDLKHNSCIMNDNHWATRFEAASRGMTPENVECPEGCWNCNNKAEPVNKELVEMATDGYLEARNARILDLFSEGISRKEIAEIVDVSYHTVCRIIRLHLYEA